MKGSTFQELREREHHLRREVIIIATEALFSQKAFHEISMKDIAKAAKVSVASIYRYFDSQDDLLLAVLLKDIDNVHQLIDDLSAAASTSLEEIACIFVDYLLDNEATFQIACHFLIRGDRESLVSERFAKVKASFLERFTETLVPSEFEQDSREFSEAFFASVFGIVIMYRERADRQTDNREALYQLARFTAKAYLRMIKQTAPDISATAP